MKLRRFLFYLFAAIALGPPGLFLPGLWAQSTAKTFTFTANSQTHCVGVTGLPTVGIQVTGTFSLTLTPYVAINGQTLSAAQVTPANSSSAQSTITSTGAYASAVGGYDTFCLSTTAYTSGTATVQLNPSGAVNAELFGGGGGAYTFFGNTQNPLTALADPTEIIDATGNFINFTTSTFEIADVVGDAVIFSGGGSAEITDSGTDTIILTGGAVTVTGKLVTAASAIGGAGFNLPPGVAPNSPVNGDLWTTSAGLFARINGSTVEMVTGGPYCATAGCTFTGSVTLDGGSFGTATYSGGATFSGALTFSGQPTFSESTGTAPFVVNSTTNVANLNASSISGNTFGAPGTIGGVTPASATFSPSVNVGVQNSTGGALNILGGSASVGNITLKGTGASPGSSTISVTTAGTTLNIGSGEFTATTTGTVTMGIAASQSGQLTIYYGSSGTDGLQFLYSSGTATIQTLGTTEALQVIPTGALTLEATSGALLAEAASGTATFEGSGNVLIESTSSGTATLEAISGNVTVEAVSGTATVEGSGAVLLESTSSGNVTVEAASGQVILEAATSADYIEVDCNGAAGTAAAPCLVSNEGATTGLFWASASTMSVAISGSEDARFNANGFNVGSHGISAGSSPSASVDIGIDRAAANWWFIATSASTTDSTGSIHAGGNLIQQTGGNQTAVTTTTCCSTWKSFSLPSVATNAQTYSFHCSLPYTLVGTTTTATFGIEGATNAVTAIGFTTAFNGAAPAYSFASAPSTSTWTSIAGPSAQTAGTYVLYVDGSVEVPTSKAITLNFGTSQSGGTSVAIQEDAFCSLS